MHFRVGRSNDIFFGERLQFYGCDASVNVSDIRQQRRNKTQTPTMERFTGKLKFRFNLAILKSYFGEVRLQVESSGPKC